MICSGCGRSVGHESFCQASERKRYALLQAAARIFASQVLPSIEGAVDDAEALLAEVESREKC